MALFEKREEVYRRLCRYLCPWLCNRTVYRVFIDLLIVCATGEAGEDKFSRKICTVGHKKGKIIEKRL